MGHVSSLLQFSFHDVMVGTQPTIIRTHQSTTASTQPIITHQPIIGSSRNGTPLPFHTIHHTLPPRTILIGCLDHLLLFIISGSGVCLGFGGCLECAAVDCSCGVGCVDDCSCSVDCSVGVDCHGGRLANSLPTIDSIRGGTSSDQVTTLDLFGSISHVVPRWSDFDMFYFIHCCCCSSCRRLVCCHCRCLCWSSGSVGSGRILRLRWCSVIAGGG
mmetsp:Transcript_18013/g.30409  ORF Transcript_18013/g.30409 Transcript_18013/m.30409 type:complete len:216 (+) Transcript_18013:2088-2735(+)